MTRFEDAQVQLVALGWTLLCVYVVIPAIVLTGPALLWLAAWVVVGQG